MSGAGIVTKRVRQADGEFAFIALRPQTKINAKDWSFRSGARENFCHLLRQANKVLAIGDGCARRFGTVAVEEKQVDVGAVVELIAAELAERQDGKRSVNDPA